MTSTSKRTNTNCLLLALPRTVLGVDSSSSSGPAAGCPRCTSPSLPKYRFTECNPANLLRLLQLPFWALVSFGALLLFRLGWGILTFNDVPEAHRELMKEIDLAKVDLRKMGVDVD